MEPEQTTQSTGGSKYIIGLVIVAVIVIGISLMSVKKDAQMPVDEKTPVATVTTTQPTGTTIANTTEVTYTEENGFSPNSLTLALGDTVKFVNKSTGKMWVAVDEHPTHREYDGTNLKQHCFENKNIAVFDQCANSAEYSFVFSKAGTWEYHNHSNPRMKGTVTVK